MPFFENPRWNYLLTHRYKYEYWKFLFLEILEILEMLIFHICVNTKIFTPIPVSICNQMKSEVIEFKTMACIEVKNCFF